MAIPPLNVPVFKGHTAAVELLLDVNDDESPVSNSGHTAHSRAAHEEKNDAHVLGTWPAQPNAIVEHHRLHTMLKSPTPLLPCK